MRSVSIDGLIYVVVERMFTRCQEGSVANVEENKESKIKESKNNAG